MAVKNEKRKKFMPTHKAVDMVKNKSTKTDPLGSYTGKPAEKENIPVQDADDL